MKRAFDLRCATVAGTANTPARDAFRRGRLVEGNRQGDRLGARLVADRSGAALVEFALAIMPIMCLFFGMMQWTLCAYANLIVQHAAYVAARAEAVMLPGMPDNGSETGSTSNLVTAVTPLFVHVPGAFSIGGSIGTLSTKIITKPTNNCDQTVDTVQVQLYFQCKIPLGNAIACGGNGVLGEIIGDLTGIYYQKLTATASFPNQGSYYQSVWNSQIGGTNSNCQTTGS